VEVGWKWNGGVIVENKNMDCVHGNEIARLHYQSSASCGDRSVHFVRRRKNE
jgi:hypothetical protein